MSCIYAIMALALNLQWGFTGLMNFGIGAFYMVGAYTSAILTGAPTMEHLGGFGLPVIVGMIGAACVAGIIAYLIAFPALKLRGSDFITDFVPAGIATQIGFIRMFFVGTILGVMILIRPQGILTQKVLTIELFREEEPS